jgi:alkane 1-monooxygenase
MNAIIGQGRFGMLPGLQVLGLLTLVMGGAWLWLGGAALLACNLLLDLAGDDYADTVERPNRPFLDAMLYSTVPLVLLLTIGLMLYTAAPGTALASLAASLGIGANGTTWWVEAAAAVFSASLLGGWACGSFAHELMHRPTRGEWLLGQLLLARCLYAAFALEHVYGHHVHVGTPADVSTPPRGLGFWRYLPRAFTGAIRGAARIEAKRMRRRGLPLYSIENRVLQGVLLEVAMVLAVVVFAGLSGLVAFLVSAVIGVLIIESGNYIGHYGLVRVPGRPVLPRHSWNAPRFFSTSTMVNLPRHSDHHRSAGTRYWGLAILDNAPFYPYGIAIMSTIALVPPLWFRVTAPYLADWDRRLASAEELSLLQGTAASGQQGAAVPTCRSPAPLI